MTNKNCKACKHSKPYSRGGYYCEALSKHKDWKCSGNDGEYRLNSRDLNWACKNYYHVMFERATEPLFKLPKCNACEHCAPYSDDKWGTIYHCKMLTKKLGGGGTRGEYMLYEEHMDHACTERSTGNMFSSKESEVKLAKPEEHDQKYVYMITYNDVDAKQIFTHDSAMFFVSNMLKGIAENLEGTDNGTETYEFNIKCFKLLEKGKYGL